MGKRARNRWNKYREGNLMHCAEPVNKYGFSEYESIFLTKMDRIATQTRGWEQHCTSYAMKMQSTSKYDTPQGKYDRVYEHNQIRMQYINAVKQFLIDSGAVLGYNARFEVGVDQNEKLFINPKNGSAQRMLNRYECLITMRELGRD